MPTAPQSMDMLNAASVANVAYEGVGLDTTTVLPCPFCATPGFMRMQPMAMAMAGDKYAIKGSCSACGRSAEAQVVREAGGTLGEFVQTGGDDPPEWFSPPMRRGEPTT